VAAGEHDAVEILTDPVMAVATDGHTLLASFARLPGLRLRAL
jgi:hypothetical protein